MILHEAFVAHDPQIHGDTPAGLALVMPMAGRGSRFTRGGVSVPKPLIDLFGKPFFWWAAESVRRAAPVREMVFVILEEHARRFALDEAVLRHYPRARIVALPEVTDGAAQTAAIGVGALAGDGPVAVCDSDHAFAWDDAGPLLEGLRSGTDAALLCFQSADPAYSYVEVGAAGAVAGTVEKRVASPFAIAGCYLFASPSTFLDAYQNYRLDCPYDELFVSGLYNRLLEAGARVDKQLLARHVSFGTPEELERVLAEPDALGLGGAGR